MSEQPPARRAATRLADTARSEQEQLARERVRFLTAEPVEPQQVRQAILTSWWRSQQANVSADRIEVPYRNEPTADMPWVEGISPVLQRLGEQLDGQPISLILTDASGVVLSQHTGDADLHRHLESVDLQPGFSYGEQFVGTNGIGTALQDHRPMHVFGHEHYAEHLENLACAGVPIQHPITGKNIGAVDLTCWRADAGGLLVTLARSTAEQIRQALLVTSSDRELELFQSYLQACRHSGGIVMALNEEVVMMNDYARQLLDPADQSVLLSRAAEAVAETERSSCTVTLRSGAEARMHCRRVGDTRTDGVVRIELRNSEEPHTAAAPAALLPTFVPGLVGQSPLWLRCCREVDTACRAGEWLILTGEAGVGKYVLARCVHRRLYPTGRFEMLDAVQATNADSVDDVVGELIDGSTNGLVLRHVDRLGPSAAAQLAAALRQVRDRGERHHPWVAVTMSQQAATNPDLAELLGLFPRTVHVPPLRYHIEDLHQLVPFFLDKLCRAGQLSCSAKAIQLLMRSDWPGNIAGLYRVLKDVTEHRRRSGELQPSDLPAEYHTLTRRTLNRLESMERDAIVESLEQTDGNKVRAARILGMSRATIYRKIREYGIVTPPKSG